MVVTVMVILLRSHPSVLRYCRLAEDSTEQLLEEDWRRRGGIWTIVIIVSGSGRFDDGNSGLHKNNLGQYYSICIYLQYCCCNFFII